MLNQKITVYHLIILATSEIPAIGIDLLPGQAYTAKDDSEPGCLSLGIDLGTKEPTPDQVRFLETCPDVLKFLVVTRQIPAPEAL